MRTSRIVTASLLGLLVGTASSSARAAESAPLSTYLKDGQTSFALSLAAKLPAREVDAVDVVVLVDTSASQQGAYREATLAGLQAMIAGMRPSDRVQILAVDVNARPLTTGFAAANSADVAQAIAAVRKQTPLGSTDVAGAVSAAAAKFEKAGSKNRAIVYIGDGVSKANLLDSPTLSHVIDQLRSARIPMSSYAIGPEVDGNLLAVLANHSGGNLYVAEPLVWQDEKAGVTDARASEENARNAIAAGKNLALWSRATVMWPEKAQLPDKMGQVYPSTFPPLRADRDTVVLGRTGAKLVGNLEVTVKGVVGGQPVVQTWTVAPQPSNNDQAYLASLVDAASRNGGLTLPTVGTAGLAEAARLMGARADQLTVLAERAVAAGDRDAAGRIAQAVLRTDPGNVQARTVQNVVASGAARPAGGMLPPQGPAEAVQGVPAAPAPGNGIRLVAPPAIPAAPQPAANPAAAAVPSDPGLLGRVGADGAFLDEVEQERRVFVGMLEKEIANTVIDARGRMASEPLQVIQDLKLALENVRRTPDLDAAKRAELEDKLEIALREASRKADLKDELDRLAQEELAAAREQKLLDERLNRQLERENQLMLRFDALMDERKYTEASEVAEIVDEIDPVGVTPVAATLMARHSRHYYLQMITRSARHEAAWETMFQMELSHIPFPDNPPIVYPDAPVWEELSKRRKARYAAVDLKGQGEAESRIYGALHEKLKTPLQAVEQPLNQVMQQISEEYEIPIVFDTAALTAAAASADTEVSIDVNNVTLRSALDLMLKQVEGLTYVVDDEVLQITTEDEANKRLQVKVYPVADLVLPIQDLGVIGGGGLGGGGLGGGGGGGLGGGGGGGQGGGGFGGGGGGGGFGGGGGGQGGGGGGFFAVPDKISPDTTSINAPVQPSGDAPAATPVQPASSPSAAKTEAEPAATAAPRVHGIEIDAAKSPEDFWSQHFAAKPEDPKTIRRAVRDLMHQKQYDHVIALVQAALQYGQAQPWMYESLGIAMDMAGRPKADIERAIMSACDFSTSPDELMFIGRFLSHIELDQRAVEVYRQVIKAAPLYQEAYALGLQAAQRAKDVDGIRWATIGILEQAWPTNQQAIRNTALRTAEATLAELRQAGDQAAAESYQSDLNKALIRDCVVTVSWSGDADVDLIVEEPSGSTCSLRTPRTPGGGVCLGDGHASSDKTAAGSFSETYVCPQGFTGDYRVRVRKVWGDVVADRVTVDVYKHYRSQDEQHERQHVTVGQDDALVVFNLDGGRRADPLEDQQLAAAIDRQNEVNSAVLAQQVGQEMSSLSDPSIIPGRGNLDPLDLRRQLALARGGSVGFQPVIVTLPDGTQMVATAVVSADRRYVRITAAPSFTGIGNVTTFTFAGAGTSTDTTDTGTDTGTDATTDGTADAGGGVGAGGGGGAAGGAGAF